MWLANLLVVLIVLGCVAYQYQKGTLVKSFATVIITICASVVAFSYFEVLANVFISRSGNSRYPSLVPWAQPLSFVLLFVLAFAILQTIVAKLTRQPIDFGVLAERIGRTVCGIFLGLILSGLLLTALAMAPLQNNYPYQRFDQTRPDIKNPNKVLFNPDGLATGWFNIISSGSFSGKKSFATLHNNFLDQVFLNRHYIADGVSIVTSSQAIEVPEKKAAWPAPEGLKDSSGRTIPPKTGHNLTIVRMGIKRNALKDAGKFTLSQLRLVCKQKSNADNLAGKGKSTYPIGYLKTADLLQIKQLKDQIKLERSDFKSTVRWLDFAFYVPNDFLPVLVEFKQNNIAKMPPPVTYEQAPPPVTFVPLAECAKDIAELQPVSSAKVYGVELAAGTKFLADLKLQISDPNQWQKAQTTRSIKPAQFKDGQINYVRAELKIEKPVEEEAEPAPTPARRKPREKRTFTPEDFVVGKRGIREMLKPLEGYKLLSLKCNNPSTGIAIKGEQLPVLVELSGLIHHPVGIIASGNVGDQTIYEVDYCSLTTEDITGGLTIAENTSVTHPFPDIVWLTEYVQSISEFYVLYLVKADRNAIIIAVHPPDSQVTAGFKEYEGFFIE